MPPKKGNNRKATKLAVAPADADILNNGEKKVVEDIATDAKILANGDSISDDNGSQVSPKLKATKRNSARNKNVATEGSLEAEGSLEKKPVAKIRGKKKLIENEVIENENNGSQPETQEIDDLKLDEEIKAKPKVRGGAKKIETKIKSSKANKMKKEEINAGDMPEETAKQVDEIKVSEKNTKTTNGRKKKQVIPEIKDEEIEQEQNIEEDNGFVEKEPRKTPRNSKKSEELAVAMEPPKKKGRSNKKEKLAENGTAEVAAVEVKVDNKEKKSTKRGRAAAAKLVTANEEPPAVNGDGEEGLPKKRTRKAPSVEREIVKEKPKRGRAKKADKEEEKFEEDAELKEEEEDDEKEEQNGANEEAKDIEG